MQVLFCVRLFYSRFTTNHTYVGGAESLLFVWLWIRSVRNRMVSAKSACQKIKIFPQSFVIFEKTHHNIYRFI